MVCLELEPGMEGADESTELWRYPFNDKSHTTLVITKKAGQGLGMGKGRLV